MAELTLTADEWFLVQAIEAGSFQAFSTDPGKRAVIRAQALIHIILGLPVAPPGELAGADEAGSASVEQERDEQARGEFAEGDFAQAGPVRNGTSGAGAAQVGRVLDAGSKDFPRAVAIRSAGIRFSHATITGKLDLQDASGPAGGMLPRLKFVSCEFEMPIRLQRARLRSLSLKGSRFTMLDASNAHIGGRVDLTGVRGLLQEPDAQGYYGQCWVVMVSTRVEGLVTARYARFVAPAERPQFVRMSWFANYALDMRAADISGSVILRPRCRAWGGITMTLANIQGSVWASGADVTAIEENAFSADYAVIRGSIYLRPFDPSKSGVTDEEMQTVLDIDRKLEKELGLAELTESERFRAAGEVSLFACKLGGSLYLDGAEIKERPVLEPVPAEEKQKVAPEQLVDVGNAEIGGDCNFSAWQCSTNPTRIFRFDSAGKVSLDAARIRNQLTFRGAKLPEVSAKNIEVGGSCNFCAFNEKPCAPIRFESAGSVEITSAKIGGDLLFCGTKIGGGEQSADAAAKGEKPKIIGLSLSGSTIGGSCFIETYSYKDHATEEQRGLRFECYGVIRFSKAKITRSLMMDGALIDARAYSSRAALDLSGSFIGADAYLRTWHEAGAAESYRFEATGGRTVIRLNGTRIGQNLLMNGARLEAKLDATTHDQDGMLPIYAVRAVNADIRGKAELSTFRGKSGGKDVYLRFESTGIVTFAMAKVGLGLNMKGSELKEYWAHTSRVPLYSSGYTKPMDHVLQHKRAHPAALDLSDAHLKFVWLGRDRWHHRVEVTGDVNLNRTKTDAEVDLSEAIVKGELSASGAKVGNKLDLGGADLHGQIKLGGAEIDGLLDLTGTTVRSRLRADGIRVGKSIRLVGTKLPTRGIAQAMAEEIHGVGGDETLGVVMAKGVWTWVPRTLLERRLHKQARLRHITRNLKADVSFQNGHVAHALEVRNLEILKYSGAVDAVEADALLCYSTVDLRSLHIGELNDLGGEEWTKNVRLWLDNFRYDRLRELPGKARDHASMRKQWLSLQYFNPKHLTKREYNPDAYEQLASGLKAIGAYPVAQKIVTKRLDLEYRGNFLWLLFGFFFGYGYSIPRAIGVFLLCIVVGWGAVRYLDTQPYDSDMAQAGRLDSGAKAAQLKLVQHPVSSNTDGVPGAEASRNGVPVGGTKKRAPTDQTILVLAMSAPEARYSYEQRQIFLVEPEETMHEHVDRVPCGNRIVPLLYAVDVFLPVLNLHQEESCSIRPEATGWRMAIALYAALGWIVTPLSILTFSGILRRHLDK